MLGVVSRAFPPRLWKRMADTHPSAAAFFHSFLDGFFAGLDGRFDVGPLFCNEARAAFNRLVERRTRLLGFLEEVFLRPSGIGFQLSPRLLSGLGREQNPGKGASHGTSEKSQAKGSS